MPNMVWVSTDLRPNTDAITRVPLYLPKTIYIMGRRHYLNSFGITKEKALIFQNLFSLSPLMKSYYAHPLKYLFQNIKLVILRPPKYLFKRPISKTG